MNPAYFKGLMKSVAEDDLGEPLLVYANENSENIVADGNNAHNTVSHGRTMMCAYKCMTGDNHFLIDVDHQFIQPIMCVFLQMIIIAFFCAVI